ncbi:hypothetical protein NUU61_000972 [Penicillium alfredii]|uniref:Uncharacterized protein n=1 Tax=Penicillium alfredii TaxID=1506179 RepID=A0A9W9KRJ8_9EURO|nr:uncharacterized protein NUU61_000972 [Penicillium alfredii]KAJ5115213.1 hypothetical protein NUU61_000972 [Penicillium alfredii]
MSLQRRSFPQLAVLFLFCLFICTSHAGFVAPKVELPEEPRPQPKTESEEDPGSGSSGGSSDNEYYGAPGTMNSQSPQNDINPPLFSDSKTAKELAEHVEDLLDAIASAQSHTATPTSSRSISSPAGALLPTATMASAATMGCSVFQSYMSLCAPTTVPTPSSTSSAAAALATDSVFASCACYSASYYVPEALDNAALACAGYTAAGSSAMLSTGLAAAATSASQLQGFCSTVGNLRHYSSTPFGKAAPTPTDENSRVQPESTSTGQAGRVVSSGFGLAVAMLASLLLI